MADDEGPTTVRHERADRVQPYLGPTGQPIAPWRRSLDDGASRAIDWTFAFLSKHWLFLANVLVGLYAFLPFLAPALLAVGATGPASVIYYTYSFLCHQRADRSFFILGEKMAYCERCAAMYPTIFFAGVAFNWLRRIRPLSMLWYLILIAPLAIDGTTQAFELRESTWELRVITGIIFGIACIWLAYPHVQRVMDESL